MDSNKVQNQLKITVKHVFLFFACKSIQLKRIGPFCIVNEKIRLEVLAQKNEVKKACSKADEAGLLLYRVTRLSLS